MQVVETSSCGFAYSDTGGDGPVVVLLHGVLMNGTLWDGVVDRLRSRYRCIVPELPFGAHRTPMPLRRSSRNSISHCAILTSIHALKRL